MVDHRPPGTHELGLLSMRLHQIAYHGHVRTQENRYYYAGQQHERKLQHQHIGLVETDRLEKERCRQYAAEYFIEQQSQA